MEEKLLLVQRLPLTVLLTQRAQIHRALLPAASANYDMKLVTADGNSYEIYSVNFGDMEKASLMLDDSTVRLYTCVT